MMNEYDSIYHYLLDRQDYFVPSSDLFIDFCQDVISRYDLHSLIRKADVTSIEHAHLHAKDAALSPSPGFCITTVSSGTFGARAVILAVGVSSNPNIPSYLSPQSLDAGWCHSSALKERAFLSDSLQMKIQSQRATHIVVIGGGLTSAQIVDLAIKGGIQKVFLICRSHVKVKDFDFPLSWVGKFKVGYNPLCRGPLNNDVMAEPKPGIVLERRRFSGTLPYHSRSS
jgi:lysine/ornithine N-monooxygenase